MVAAPLLLFLVLPLLALAQAPPPSNPPPPPLQALSSDADLNALYSLRASLAIRARDWPRRADPCAQWRGVGCRGGRVVSLHLSTLRRTRLGRAAPRLALDALPSLSRLESFNSSGFLLPGVLPTALFASLPAPLSVLDLSRSSISGAIPAGLANSAALAVLDLSGNSLSGAIPSDFVRLRNLTSLDLSGNNLTGPIPTFLASLPRLDALSLSSNPLGGGIPPDLAASPQLRRLLLSDARLSGVVPVRLGNLSMLAELDLSANTFSGGLPDSLFALPELRLLDVSSSNLSGNLPAAVLDSNATSAVFNLSGNSYYGPLPSGIERLLARLSVFDVSRNYLEGELPPGSSSSGLFVQNCFSNGFAQRSATECVEFYNDRGLVYAGSGGNHSPTEQTPGSTRKSRRKLTYILVGVFGGLGVLVVLVSVILLCSRKRSPSSARPRETAANAVNSRASKQVSSNVVNMAAVGDSFTYAQLVQATSNFSDGNLIKHGRSGDLFLGSLESGASVVVKRIDVRSFKAETFLAELDFFSHASHTRLVPFLGHCLENENEKLLVYKYMRNRDLSNALYRKKGDDDDSAKSLDWITRLKIATGVAEALYYLHHEHVPSLVHRDIQASSILLDDKFEVRLGSLSNVCPQGDSHHGVITRFLRSSQSTEPGTSGSTAASCTYDVYCLGKVLLELVTGKLGLSGRDDATTNEWLEQTMSFINSSDKDHTMKIVDPSLILDEDFMEEVWAMAIVAKSCLNPKPSKRPLMKHILKALENPLRVVRDEIISNSARLRATSSRGSWNAAIFGSWRSASDVVSISGRPREPPSFKRLGATDSQRSAGEHSFNNRRQSNEIFPEPASTLHEIDV